MISKGDVISIWSYVTNVCLFQWKRPVDTSAIFPWAWLSRTNSTCALKARSNGCNSSVLLAQEFHYAFGLAKSQNHLIRYCIFFTVIGTLTKIGMPTVFGRKGECSIIILQVRWLQENLSSTWPLGDTWQRHSGETTSDQPRQVIRRWECPEDKIVRGLSLTRQDHWQYNC